MIVFKPINDTAHQIEIYASKAQALRAVSNDCTKKILDNPETIKALINKLQREAQQ